MNRIQVMSCIAKSCKLGDASFKLKAEFIKDKNSLIDKLTCRVHTVNQSYFRLEEAFEQSYKSLHYVLLLYLCAIGADLSWEYFREYVKESWSFKQEHKLQKNQEMKHVKLI